MKKVKKYVSMLNPFQNREDIPTPVFVAKKLLAFWFLYLLVGCIAGEIFIIGGLTLAGYDPIKGIMPADSIMQLIQYYGFAFFLLAAILYCKFVENTDIKKIGFNNKYTDYLSGGILAILLLVIVVAISCATGGMTYSGLREDVEWKYTIALLGGFVIQGAAEEALCRGFLMQSLLKKVSVPWAVFLSATMFAIPHLASMEADLTFKVLGIVNLYLVSILFSLLILLRSNLWISCGLHSVWNFVLYGMMGLNVSGEQANETGIFSFVVNGSSIFNGGAYGVEASIITTIVLGTMVVLCYKKLNKI